MKLLGRELTFNNNEIWHKGNFDPASKVDKAEFDNLEIGGRNLILNSDFSQGLTNWTKTSNAISLEVGGGYRGDGLRLVMTTTGTVTPRQRINLELMANDTLTGQVKVKTIQGNFSNMVMRVANQLTIPLVSVKQLDNDWELYTYRVTVSSPITLSNDFGFYNTTGEFIIDEIKLERGNKATDWTPAPEDIQAEIEKKADMSVVPTKTSQLTNDSGFITSSASITGNAATATKLQTARTIGLSGDVIGSANFDGSSNITINATVVDDSHNHVISNIDNLQTTLNSKAPLASPAFTGTPTAPTAPNGTNTNQIATTAFVQNALSAGGYGDMMKSVYDKNNDGIVDNAEKVNGFTVDTNVPANAKFTDTTYSEITTSEIDAGTSSTLRTISGRRIKYILDKVQGWLNNKVDKIAGKGLSTEDYTTIEKNKLAGIENGANKYIHPTTSGNKHIPSGGSSGQFLKWQSDGTAIWDNVTKAEIENSLGYTPAKETGVKNTGTSGGTAFTIEETNSEQRAAIYLTRAGGRRAGFFWYGKDYAPRADMRGKFRIHLDDKEDVLFTNVNNVLIDGNKVYHEGNPPPSGDIYHVGTTPPSDTSIFWIDTSS